MRKITHMTGALKSESRPSIHYVPDKSILYATHDSYIQELNKKYAKPSLAYANFTSLDTSFNEGIFLDWSEDVSPDQFETNITLSESTNVVDDKTLIYPYIGRRTGSYKVYQARVFETEQNSSYIVINRNVVTFLDKNSSGAGTVKDRGRPIRNGIVFYTYLIVSSGVTDYSASASFDGSTASTANGYINSTANNFRMMGYYNRVSRSKLIDKGYTNLPEIDNAISSVSSIDDTSTSLQSLRNGFIVYASDGKTITYKDKPFFSMIYYNSFTQTNGFDNFYTEMTKYLAQYGVTDENEVAIDIFVHSMGFQMCIVSLDSSKNETLSSNDSPFALTSVTNIDYDYVSEFMYVLEYAAFTSGDSYYAVWAPLAKIGVSTVKFSKYVGNTTTDYMSVSDTEYNEMVWARYKLEVWSQTYTIIAPKNSTHHGQIFSQTKVAIDNWSTVHARTPAESFYNVDFDAWKEWAIALLTEKHSDLASYDASKLFSTSTIGTQTFTLSNMQTIKSIGTTLETDGTVTVSAYIDTSNGSLLAVKTGSTLGSRSTTNWTMTLSNYSNEPNEFKLIAECSDGSFEEVGLTIMAADSDSTKNEIIEAYHFANNL